MKEVFSKLILILMKNMAIQMTHQKYLTNINKFDLKLDFNQVRFLTNIYHPNIRQQNGEDDDGEVCVNTLKENWNPNITVQNS
jgi:hypothetical protein